MRNVELFSADGLHSVKILSAPPFTTPPEVVVWGIRIFILVDEDPRGDGVPVYREAITFRAPADA